MVGIVKKTTNGLGCSLLNLDVTPFNVFFFYSLANPDKYVSYDDDHHTSLSLSLVPVILLVWYAPIFDIPHNIMVVPLV